MKKFYSILLLFFFLYSFSQSYKLQFDYDSFGNQVFRELLTNNESNKTPSFLTTTKTISPIQEINIYPNPVITKVYFQMKEKPFQQLKKIEIHSYNGIIIKEQICTGKESQVSFDMSPFPAGVYYLKAYFSDGSIQKHSLIKQ